uniref:Fatty acid desaturase domain-containing protein n=2 Tax=Arion vulgaris TaxID=1028688 RepID=A0A0B7BB71_9EUPU
MDQTPVEGANPKPSRFLIVWFLLRSLLVTHNGEESSQPEDDQVAVADSIPPALDDDALAKVNLPRKLPSIVEIKKAIPQQCFESNTPLSIYYMIKDFVLVAGLYLLVEWTWTVFPPATQFVITPLYWLLQGTMFTGLFVAGHDAGHGSFSNSELVNTICGNICHTFLFCPYYMWKISHRKHHKNTGNIDKDEVFYPVRKRDDNKLGVLPGFGLGVGWFAYLIKGYKPRGVHHFNPLDPMFRYHVMHCIISMICLILWSMCLARVIETLGLGVFCYHYVLPEFVFGSYTVIITFLHHHDDDIPWYADSLWDNVRGQLSSVDRSYGWCHHLIHHIGTHQIHHLFPKIPHYNLEEATSAFRKAFPKLVNIRQEPILPAFCRMFRKYVKHGIITDDALLHQYK